LELYGNQQLKDEIGQLLKNIGCVQVVTKEEQKDQFSIELAK
jgi:hypothetical protein